jgi:hypothetical protein
MHATPRISLNSSADDMAARDADKLAGEPHCGMAQSTCCRDSRRGAKVYTAPRRKS